MRTDVLQVATVALAMATETAEHADSDVMWSLMDELPEGTDAHLFVALLRTYQRQRETYGLEALQHAALGWARRTCGLEP